VDVDRDRHGVFHDGGMAGRSLDDGNVPGGNPRRYPQAATAWFAPIAIGVGLTLIKRISILDTDTSAKPARSTSVAQFAGNGAISQP
jgi:hypothetical protein